MQHFEMQLPSNCRGEEEEVQKIETTVIEKNGRLFLFLCLISMLGTAQCHENKVNELKHNLSLVVRKTLHHFISGAHCRTATSRNDKINVILSQTIQYSLLLCH